MGRAAPALSRRALVAVVRRPDLWPTAVRQALALAPTRWWRRWPPVPSPAAGYLRFRLETQYGDAVHAADGSDLVQYLAWCRHERAAVRAAARAARRGRARTPMRARSGRR